MDMIMAGVVAMGEAAAAAAILALTITSSSAPHDKHGRDNGVCANMVVASQQECAVCLSDLAGVVVCCEPEASTTGAAVRALPGCGHGFHEECIVRWLPLRAECPLCRRPVVAADVPPAAAVPVAVAEAAPVWSRPAMMACGFGNGRLVWTRSPSAQELSDN